MLDDLARAFGCDRGLVVVYDPDRGLLRGASGFNVPNELVDALEIPITEHPSVLLDALESAEPVRVDSIARDPRLHRVSRAILVEAGFERAVFVPVHSADREPLGVVVLSRPQSFGTQELRALAAVTGRARDVLTRVRDAAESKETGESEAVEKEWLWWMVNAQQDPVVLTDEANEIGLRNMPAERLFLAREDDSAGRRHAVWMNNFMFTAALSSWKLEPAGGAAAREVTLVDPAEGTEIVYEVIAKPATNYRDGSRGTVSVLKDVTGLRHVAEELARGQQQLQSAGEAVRIERDRLELVLRSVPNPIVVLGGADQPMTLNAAALRLFGTQGARTAVSARSQQLQLTNETRLTSFLSQFALEPGQRKTGELAITDPETEEPLEMAATVTEVRDHRGAVIGIVAALQDIGRLRELERRRVEQILFDSEKLAATGRLAASIAHELNNPLEAIQNSLYVLLERVPQDSPDRTFVEIARKETARMSRILREMLGFYKPQLDMGLTHVNALIDEAEALLAKRLRERGVKLDKRLDQHLPTIRASSDQLKQVILNLLLNAADAMPQGGTVTISTTVIGGTKIGLPSGRSVQLQVRDTGVGISEEHLQRVFEPFFSTKGAKGSGLGLWVSSGIVQAHGGSLQVRSVEGRGTVFTIVLPVEGPPKEAATGELARPGSPA
jgi:signal transduction histidine kinase